MNRLLNNIAAGYFCYHFVVVFFISFSTVFRIESCKKMNEMNGIDEICGMIARLWLPFDYDFFPVKQIIFVYEVCTLYAYYIISRAYTYTVVNVKY